MLAHMRDPGRQLSKNEIDAFDRVIGMRLPDDYRAFLLRYNGGIPSPRAFPIEGLKNNPYGAIQEFLGIDCELETSNLDWKYDVMNGRLPSNLFAIACDDCGDLICLSLFGDDAGSVLFWDCHQETDEPGYHNVYRIAGSFSEFLDSLQELPESAD